MKRHAFDPTSFVAGLVLGAIALAYLLAEQLDRTVDGRWVLPVALIGLGVAGIAGALGGLRRNGEVGVTPPAPAAPTPAPTDPATTAGAAGPSAPQE